MDAEKYIVYLQESQIFLIRKMLSRLVIRTVNASASVFFVNRIKLSPNLCTGP